MSDGRRHGNGSARGERDCDYQGYGTNLVRRRGGSGRAPEWVRQDEVVENGEEFERNLQVFGKRAMVGRRGEGGGRNRGVGEIP